jgi:hypothetical protein
VATRIFLSRQTRKRILPLDANAGLHQSADLRMLLELEQHANRRHRPPIMMVALLAMREEGHIQPRNF